MKIFHLTEPAQFSSKSPTRQVFHDSPGLRIITFQFEPGQEMPVHAHHADAELAFMVLEGEGVYSGEDMDLRIRPGTLQILSAGEPHGFKATTRLRLLTFIAPAF
jgi:quercetin dioxygenase-like cupin family protein